MTTKRNTTIDIISGILIIWMIIYHSFQWGHLTEANAYKYLLRCFYYFMPWFYFKSGYFFNSKRPLTIVVRKSLGQIFVPMVIWTLIGYITTIPELVVSEVPIWKILINPVYFLLRYGDTLGNAPLWFLFSLFIVRIVMSFFAKLKLKYLIFVTIFFACLGWIQQLYYPQPPFGHQSFPLGISFALIGFICNREEVVNIISKIKIAFLLITLIMSVFFASYIDVHSNHLEFGYYWFFIINSLFAIFLLMIIFGYVKPKLIAWIGEKSMFYLVIHWPVFYIINYLCVITNIPQDNYFYLLLLNTGAIILSTLAAKFLPEKYIGLDGAKVIEEGKRIFIKMR